MHTDWLPPTKAFALAAVLVFFTDWYFFGRPALHRHFDRFPGVWKKFDGQKSETRAITLSALVSFAVCAVFVAAAGWLGVTGLRSALVLALVFWVAGPLAHLVTQSMWMNLDRTVAVNHAIGWLVRFVACAVGVAVFL